MEIFKQIAPLKAFLRDLKRAGKSVGLVPTMGALHAGHVSLFRSASAENHVTVGSIYVNPIQFNNQNDLLKYPRTLEKDTELLQTVGCDVLFVPDNQEMYPERTTISIDFGHLDKVMEGKFRPGHFSGVALVVSKLFNIVEPHHAYFGQKDWQQYAIIRQLVEELNYNLVLHSVPTSREPDGLAMSSRNLRLSERQRQKAIVFYDALSKAKQALTTGEDLENVKKSVRKVVETDPEIKLEYF